MNFLTAAGKLRRKLYLYFIFRNSMRMQSSSVTAFETKTGKDFISSPYATHSTIPVQRMTNIDSEMSFVDFDFHALTNCGKKEIVVSVPARNPKIFI